MYVLELNLLRIEIALGVTGKSLTQCVLKGLSLWNEAGFR